MQRPKMAHPGIWKPFRRRFWTRISTGDDIDNVWGGGWRKYPLSLVRSQYLLFYVFRGHSGVWKRQGEDDGRIGVQVSARLSILIFKTSCFFLCHYLLNDIASVDVM